MRKKVFKFSRLLCLCSTLLVSVFLTACGSKTFFPDLQEFVDEVQAKPKGRIKPLPEFKAHSTFAYSAAAMRSPFEPPIVIQKSDLVFDPDSIVEPDFNRPKEYLEQFSFDALKMVGTIQKPDDKQAPLWALINDGQGQIHRVKNGDYIGRSHGKVMEIFSNRIDVMEIVPSGEVGPDGNKLWIERPRNLILKAD